MFQIQTFDNQWMATLLHVSTSNFFKVNSKNVLNSFLVVFCCKIGVYHGLKSEISYQGWCRENTDEYCTLSIESYQIRTFNIEIHYVLIVHRVLWKRNSTKSGQGVTYILAIMVQVLFLKNQKCSPMVRWV